MSEAQNGAVLDRLYGEVWLAQKPNFDVMDDVFAEDAVVEYPQSGERFCGRANIRAAEENYPGLPDVSIRRKIVASDVAVVETDLNYDGERYQEVSIFEFRGGRISQLVQYFPAPFDAPDSRAQWAEKV